MTIATERRALLAVYVPKAHGGRDVADDTDDGADDADDDGPDDDDSED